MNIIYSSDKLFVELEDNITANEILRVKNRLFSILNSYSVEEVVLNTSTNVNEKLVGKFVNEYHKKFDGVIRVNYR